MLRSVVQREWDADTERERERDANTRREGMPMSKSVILREQGSGY
jgi:hypothetical protein